MTIEIRNNKILTQGGKVRTVCDPCVTCVPPDPCLDGFWYPDFVDPSNVDFNPSYDFNPTITNEVIGVPFGTNFRYQDISIAKSFRVVVEENPTIVITFELDGSDPYSNLSLINEWGSVWTFVAFKPQFPSGSVSYTLVEGAPVSKRVRRTRNPFTCNETFTETFSEVDPSDNGIEYQIFDPITKKYLYDRTDTTTSNPPVTNTTTLYTRRETAMEPPLPISSCTDTIFYVEYRLWTWVSVFDPGNTGNPPGRCNELPSVGSVTATGRFTLDVEY